MKHRWLWAWALQILEMLVTCLVVALLHGAAPHAILLWGGVPLAGLLTACQAVRRGLNNYAAWIAPPACLFAVYLLLWGFSPPAGAALLSALASLIGAAAGQVIVERRDDRGRGRHRRS